MRSFSHITKCMFFPFCMTLGILANTEIRNIKAVSTRGVDECATNWPVLKSQAHETTLALDVRSPVVDKEHLKQGVAEAVWVVLDLDDPAWASYEHFTVKVSNPASISADVELEIFTLSALTAQYNNMSAVDPAHSITSRKQYAHISAKISSVASPPHSGRIMTARFILSIEPLSLGVVPMSVLPLIASIPVLILLAHLAGTYLVLPFLESVARGARADIDAQHKNR
ncbi:unnamed protein product [Peniophora sp. CBMAI 1063]|nr:unnamed protein product [Peniophora sp. CBMAI 1063]